MNLSYQIRFGAICAIHDAFNDDEGLREYLRITSEPDLLAYIEKIYEKRESAKQIVGIQGELQYVAHGIFLNYIECDTMGYRGAKSKLRHMLLRVEKSCTGESLRGFVKPFF